MSSLSGRHMSRDDYYQSANFVADSLNGERSVGGEVDEDEDEDRLLPGDYGGRGVGLAGGYPGSQLPPPAPTTTTTTAAASASAHAPNPYPPITAPPALALAGAGDDLYAGYDPGMAGCTTEQGTCHIPGVPHIGAEHALAHAHAHAPHVHARGYERDADEYANGTPTSASSSADLDTHTSPAGANANAGGSATRSDSERRPRHPSIGTRLVGRVERLAGKVLRDPDIEARGRRHMTSAV